MLDIAAKVLSSILVTVLVVAAVMWPIGFVMNVVKTVKLDWQEPYRAEAIRALSLAFYPAAGVVGWIDLEDK